METKNICRACLTENGTFQSIFLEKSNSGCLLHISEMMSACATIQVTEGDELPEQICSECAEVTVKMYLFKLKCENSDRILRAKLKNAQAETVELTIKLEIKTEKDEEAFIEDIANFENYKYKTEDDQEMLETNNEIKIEYEELALKQLNNIGEFVCDICQENFNRIDLLTIHQTVHNIKMEELEIKYEPDQVNPISVSSPNNKNIPGSHMYDLHVKKESEESFEEDLVREQLVDMKSISESKPFNCDICFKGFNKTADLKNHTRTHILNNDESFTNSDSLPEHKVTNFKETNKTLKPNQSENTVIKMDEKLLERDVCQNKVARLSSLKALKSLGTGEKPYECDVCEKKFALLTYLNRHKRIHTGEKPYECDICKKKFRYLQGFKIHKLMHMGKKPLECDTCKKRFRQISHLVLHKRTHTGEKPFKCDMCEKTFTRLSTLNAHKRIYTGEKPFECDACEKSFTQLSHLVGHKRIHTGEKPYKCDVCKRNFTLSQHLKRHKLTHTGEKTYECDTCNKKFGLLSNLNRHKKNHHSG